MNIIPEINNRLRAFRESTGLGQKEFAQLIGVNTSYYSDIENARRKVTNNLLAKIQKHYEISGDWIFNGKQNNSEESSFKNTPNNTPKSTPKNKYLGKNKSLTLIGLLKGNEAFYIANTTAETIKTDITINKFFGVSMAADHIIEKYLNPLLEISETENIDYKEFIKKYFEKLNSYKPYSQSLIDFIAAFEKFCKEMYDLGDTYFEIFDKEFIKNELEKGEN